MTELGHGVLAWWRVSFWCDSIPIRAANAGQKGTALLFRQPSLASLSRPTIAAPDGEFLFARGIVERVHPAPACFIWPVRMPSLQPDYVPHGHDCREDEQRAQAELRAGHGFNVIGM